MTKWQSDITDFSYEFLSSEKLNFAFEQFKQCNLNTLENRKVLEQKSLAIIGALVTISSAVLGFLITHCDLNKPLQNQSWEIILPALVLVSMFYHAMRLVITVLYPVKYYPPGNEPQMILTQEQFDQPLRWMIFSEAHNMQERIAKNDALNEQKGIAIQKALSLSAFAPLVSISMFALIKASPAIFHVLALWIGWFAQLGRFSGLAYIPAC